MQSASADLELLQKFDAEVWQRIPHTEGDRVANPTPLVDFTDDLAECAEAEYGIRLGQARVLAKLDSKLSGGSVKARPAASILRDAIASGRLVRGQTVFEATSGNFGLALGSMGRLGVDVVALVSRKLQEGVTRKLRADGVRLVDLDIDVCPAPGIVGDANAMMAKGVASNVRQQLATLGYDPKAFDVVRGEAEELLARQDAIGLAKLMARAYGGFCPEQYDNELNVKIHETVTGPELDQQLKEAAGSLAEFDFVCAFGTGGTATGVSRYVGSTHSRKGVRVVYPLAGQDVAGIRTKDKATGLRFYQPESYLGEHEVDFEQARKVSEFFNRKGRDIGESGALALYAAIQLVNFGHHGRLVVLVADDASKYVSDAKPGASRPRREQVRLDEAASSIREYSGVVWTHSMFAPRPDGVELIARSLGCQTSEVKVASPGDVQAVLGGREPSKAFEDIVPKDGRPVLLVCMVGGTSLMMAKALGQKGVLAESLVGGITGLPGARSRNPAQLVEMARR